MNDQASPVGKTVSDHIAECQLHPKFRAEWERLRPYNEFARIVLMRRAALGWTQAELAARMGSTASEVSRIESGQHATNPQTPQRARRRIRRPGGNRLRVGQHQEA